MTSSRAFAGMYIVAIFVAVFIWHSGIAHAAITTDTASDVTGFSTTVKASSDPKVIIGLNIAGNGGETIATTSVSMNFQSGFLQSELAALGTATSSGIALYRDNKTIGTRGTFDATDVVIPLQSAPVFTGATTTLTLATAEPVLANDTGNNLGNDYFIVVTTSATATNAHAFSMNIYPGEVGFTAGNPMSTPTTLTTATITVDTAAPTLNAGSTGPANNSTGVPVSTFIHVGFSENLDQTTLNSSTITLTTGGTPVGSAVRPFPDGFDLVVSSPPTYAALSRFAKASTVSTGFFFINGTNPIFAQGGYTTPAAGDIVFMQVDTFPPEVGLITNATMTSGTFAINGFAAFRPMQITKFATPQVTGLVSGSTAVGVGDIVVANTSANPTGVKYDWHVVTTGAAVNDAALRLDGASAAPTFASGSRFSSILPAATTTIDASALVTATTTFAAGDLVFAKLSAGGGAVNTYAWHLVTTGEVVNAPSGAATTSTLRLDGAAIPPTFAPSSVVSKIASAAQGAVDSGVQDATAFSFGDMMFAKVTANAANTGGYAFHIVSNPATGATSTALRLDNSASNLQASTQYVVTATTGVKDKAGNPLASAQTVTFTTGSTGSTNTTPPFVQSSQPQGGNQSFAPNSPIKLTFSVGMNNDVGGANSVLNSSVVKLSTDVNGAPGAQVSATNTYDSSNNTVTITPASNLAINTGYLVQVTTAVRSSTGTPVPQEYRLYFRTAAAVDNTAPTVLGASPASGVSDISLSPVFAVGFSKDMDASTITSSKITLATQIGATSVAGVVSYTPSSRSAAFVPSVALSASTGYKLTVTSGGSGVKDLSGNALAANYIVFATTTASADNAAPSVSFASADNFGIAVTFSEQVRTGGSPNAADNIANYTLESPVGTSMSLGGKTVTYDASTRTARISGLSLQNGNTFKVTVSTPVQDLAGNAMSTAGTPAGNTGFGAVQNSTATGGNLGPGSGTINQSEQGMNPTRVSPMTRSAGATSNYKIEFLAGTSIPSTGQIVLTFPAGFDVTNAAAVSSSVSFCNADMNGPATGVPTISGVVADNAAGTITMTTQTDATGANFLCMELSGIVNSTIPSSSGYTVDIKTRNTAANNRSVIETKTASPFFLGASGSRTLTVNVFNDGNSNGANNANEGIESVRVFLFSPASGAQNATTNASGVASFTSIADGDYMIGIDPGSLASASSTVTFNSAPQPFTVSASSLTKNFIVSSSASALSLSGTVTGANGTRVDVFASSPNGFVRKTLTLTGGADAYSLPVAASTTYQVGVGPAMPDTFFTPGAPPPPPPTFTFMPPPNISVTVNSTSVSGKNFTLTTTNKTITGSVVDQNGTGVSNAGVFARPVSTSTIGSTSGGFGTGGQTGASGTFTLNVVPGTYLVGVAKPGMPNVPDQQIVVPSTGANSPTTLTFKLGAGTSLTVSGTVKDDNGNAIPYAGVNARRVVSSADTTPIGGSEGNFVGGPTDANGAYTLYVSAGTWVVEAFAPNFGKLGSKTVTVTTSSLSGQDFSAQTLSLGTITGTTTKASVVQQGVIVRAEGVNGANMGNSDANGVYTLKVPAGTYSVFCQFPGVGEATPLTNVTVTANATTYNNNCALAAPITITVRLTDGTSPVTNAYVDVRNSFGRGNGTNISTVSGANAEYTVVVPPGTYTVRVGHPAYGTIGSTAGVDSTQTITYTASAGALFRVTGSVTDGSSALANAWVSLFGTPTGQTNTISMGGQTDSSGVFAVSVPAGVYNVRADKPGYISPTPATESITAAKTLDPIALSTASLTITGTVSLSGTGVSGAYVDATDGTGGFVVGQTDTSGAYSLSVKNGSWSVRAHSLGYEGGPLPVTVAGLSRTSQDISLTAISGFTVRPERQETVTPTSGGLLTNSDIGDGFKLNIPANALGTGSNAGTVTTQVNTGVPNAPNGTVLSKNAVSINAVDSSGQPVKTLNDGVTIVIPYTEADLPSGASESSLQIGVWNDSSQTYDILSTTIDTANNTLTATVSHFSDFAPIVSTSASVSSGGGGGGGSSGGGGGGVIGQVSVPTMRPRAQIIYPDGRVVYVDQMSSESAAPSSITSTDSGGLSAKFSVPLKQGSSGNDVKRLQKLLGVDPTGYFGAMTRAAVEAFQIKRGIAKKGDAGFGTLGPKTRAELGAVFGGTAVKTQVVGTESAGRLPGAVAVLSGGAFVRALNLRASGSDVKTLQVLLNTDADTRVAESGDGSRGRETDFFGRATLRAVQKFQLKYGLAIETDSFFGNVGPKTRAKLNEILARLSKPAVPEPAATTSAATVTTASTTSTAQ